MGLEESTSKKLAAKKRRFLYYGWIKYHDVFDNTPQHTTRFCYEVIVYKLPKNRSPIVATDIHYKEYIGHNFSE